jgi:hypothetical protein
MHDGPARTARQYEISDRFRYVGLPLMFLCANIQQERNGPTFAVR